MDGGNYLVVKKFQLTATQQQRVGGYQNAIVSVGPENHVGTRIVAEVRHCRQSSQSPRAAVGMISFLDRRHPDEKVEEANKKVFQQQKGKEKKEKLFISVSHDRLAYFIPRTLSIRSHPKAASQSVSQPAGCIIIHSLRARENST